MFFEGKTVVTRGFMRVNKYSSRTLKNLLKRIDVIKINGHNFLKKDYIQPVQAWEIGYSL